MMLKSIVSGLLHYSQLLPCMDHALVSNSDPAHGYCSLGMRMRMILVPEIVGYVTKFTSYLGGCKQRKGGISPSARKNTLDMGVTIIMP